MLIYYEQSMNLKKYIEDVKSYIKTHESDIKVGVPIVVFVVALVGAIMFATYRNMPNIVYQPVKACSLLTPAEAQSMLGERVISVEKDKPVIVKDLATSKCSYTDENPDQNGMMVAAVAVRSGINDKGVAQNKADFAAAKAGKAVEEVKGLRGSAYFDNEKGLLNILDGRSWIILNYGVGAAQEANSIEKAIEFAHKVQN